MDDILLDGIKLGLIMLVFLGIAAVIQGAPTGALVSFAGGLGRYLIWRSGY